MLSNPSVKTFLYKKVWVITITEKKWKNKENYEATIGSGVRIKTESFTGVG
jgi:hypothetical protein